MRRPALWLAAALALGIEIGLEMPAAKGAPHSSLLAKLLLAAILAAIAAGLAFYWKNHNAFALAAGLAAWTLIGTAGAILEGSNIPPDFVTQMAAQGRLDLSSPHRWIGRLRDDPLRLPWGARLQIDLESVESEGTWMPAQGGLRLNYYLDKKDSLPLPAVRAGDRVEALAAAHEPRNFQDPGVFDLRGYLAQQGVDLTGTLRAAELLEVLPTTSVPLAARIARIRGNLLARTNALFPGDGPTAAVIRAMVLGDRSFVDSELALPFQETGAYHVLVVAGLHVGIFLAFIYWITRFARMRRWTRTLVAIAALAGYVAIVQDRTPVLRAALMAAIFLTARPLFRRVDLLHIVSLAALILLFWKSSLLQDASFQLSFLAVTVVAAIAVPWLERTTEPWIRGLRHLGDTTRDVSFPARVVQFRLDLRTIGNWVAARLPSRAENWSRLLITGPVGAGLRIWELFAISVALQIGMLPLMASYFHRMTLSGPLSNIPAVLLTGLIVPAAFVTLGLSAVSARLAAAGAWVVSRLVAMLLASVHYFADWPHGSWRIPEPPLLLTIAFLALLGLMGMTLELWLRRRGNHPGIVVAAAATGVCLLTVIIAISPFPPRYQRGELEVTTLDVGQGDSIFVIFPSGKTMLVDGGGLAGEERVGGYHTGFDVGEEVVSPYLWQRGVKSLDVVMLTHAHHDHMDGLRAVLRNFKVKELWVGRDADTPAYRELMAEANQRHVRILHERRGDTFQWEGVDGAILWPPDNDAVKKPSNNDSVVLRLTYGGTSLMLSGDVERQAESAIAGARKDIHADFLKVPHHGSKSSSTPEFLQAVSPAWAAISVGADNNFGQPNPATLERLRDAKVHYWTTMQAGAITALSDGHAVSLHTYVTQE